MKKLNKSTLLVSKYKNLVAEWHPTKNGNKKPSDYSYGSNHKAWWICNSCNNEFDAVISKRTIDKQGCPFCGPIVKRIKVGFNDLTTTHPALTSEWHPTKNGNKKPSDYSYGSSYKAWWQCPNCNYPYRAKISARVRGTGCIICSSKIIQPGYNDLKTKYPEIALDWDYSKNKDFSPENVFPHSEKEYYWKCHDCGYEWKTSPDSRTQSRKCPKCSKFLHTSFPEQTILFYIKKLFPDTINRFLEFGIELDIYIPSIKTAIEYDGVYYHKGNIKAENQKDKICKQKGIRLIRIREKGLKETSSAEVIIRDKINNKGLEETITSLLSKLGKYLDFSIEKDYPLILNQYKTYYENSSLKTVNPGLSSEWHPTKNGSLKPDNILAGSGAKVYWLCPTCHGTWQATVVSRNKGTGCPYCSNQKLLVGYNDLATKNPFVALDWHPLKNSKSAKETISTTNKKAFWLCHNCGYEWESNISSRTLNGTGCRKCSNKKRALHNRVNRISNGTMTFAEKYPELSKEWHPTKNGEITPSNITFGSAYKAWWKCSICGEDWQQMISNRRRYKSLGCKECKNKSRGKKQSIQSNEFRKKLILTHPNIELLSNYTNSHTLVKCHCKKCDNTWDVLPYSILRQEHGCPECSKVVGGLKRRTKHVDFINELKEKNPSIKPLERYVRSNVKISCKCLVCNKIWPATPSKLLSGRGCPNCARRAKISKNKKDINTFKNEIKSINPNVLILGEYVNARTPIKYTCKNCEKTCEALPTNMLRGIHCNKNNK